MAPLARKFIFKDMRGSLLISYEDTDGIGGDFLTITKNGVIMVNLYEASDGLYSIPLIVGKYWPER